MRVHISCRCTTRTVHAHWYNQEIEECRGVMRAQRKERTYVDNVCVRGRRARFVVLMLLNSRDDLYCRWPYNECRDCAGICMFGAPPNAHRVHRAQLSNVIRGVTFSRTRPRPLIAFANSLVQVAADALSHSMLFGCSVPMESMVGRGNPSRKCCVWHEFRERWLTSQPHFCHLSADGMLDHTVCIAQIISDARRQA